MLKRLILLLGIATFGFAQSPSRVYKTTKDKIVKIGIISVKPDKDGKLHHRQGVCSGAFINKDGMVLTCAHCFEEDNITKVFVKKDNGEVSPVYLIRTDKVRDLALVVTNFEHTPYLKEGKEVKIGEQVFSFGSSLGLQHTMTVGYVSNVVKVGLAYIFHSAFILPGNSGGPLVDEHGNLVGINEAALMENFLIPAAGYYIAIDLTTIKAFLGEK